MHFALVGLILGIGAPVALSYALVMFDGRARGVSEIQNIIQAPVLGEVTSFKDAAYKHELIKWFSIATAAFVAVLLIYGYVAWIRIIN